MKNLSENLKDSLIGRLARRFEEDTFFSKEELVADLKYLRLFFRDGGDSSEHFLEIPAEITIEVTSGKLKPYSEASLNRMRLFLGEFELEDSVDTIPVKIEEDWVLEKLRREINGILVSYNPTDLFLEDEELFLWINKLLTKRIKEFWLKSVFLAQDDAASIVQLITTREFNEELLFELVGPIDLYPASILREELAKLLLGLYAPHFFDRGARAYRFGEISKYFGLDGQALETYLKQIKETSPDKQLEFTREFVNSLESDINNFFN